MRTFYQTLIGMIAIAIGLFATVNASMIVLWGDLREVDAFRVFIGSTAVSLSAVLGMGFGGFFLRRVMIDNFGIERKYREKSLWKPAAFSIALLGAATICFAHVLFTETIERVLEAFIVGTIMLVFASIFSLFTGLAAADSHK